MNLSSKVIVVILGLGASALMLLALLVAALALGPTFRPLGATPTPTLPPGTHAVSGMVRDIITGQGIPNALVSAGPMNTLTDESGTFSLPVPAGASLHVSAANYEDQDLLPQGEFVSIDLVPTPRATYELIHYYQIQHEYGRQYDLLHPDAQAQFSRDDFVRYMERTVDYEIVARNYGDVAMVPVWTFQGRVYTNTAQVPFTLTIRQDDKNQTQSDTGYLVRAHGTWRWFRGPLGQPTATPPWPPSVTPVGPVATPTPLPSPFPVGSWVQVTASSLNVRSGPGSGYPVVTTVSYGTRLRILSGPSSAGGAIWYEVTDDGSVHGWCNDLYLTPSSDPTPTTGSWFPVGSWVLVSSPDGWMDVQSAPGPGNTPVTVVYNGTRLRIEGGPNLTSGAPWYEVVDQGQTFRGWCYGPYLTPTSPPVTPTPTGGPVFPIGSWVQVQSPDGQLNIRQGPGMSYPIIAVLLNGQPLQIVGRPTVADGAAWYEVLDRERAQRGWCNGQYLVLMSATPTPPPTPGPVYPVGAWVQVQSPDGQLNVRQGPGSTYPVIYVAHNGDWFRILSGPPVGGELWYEVTNPTGAIQGWANGQYLVLASVTPTPTPPSGGARFTELQFCVIPPGGGAADCSGSFRAPIYEVYIVWDYAQMQPGMTVRRVWYYNGQHLRTLEDTWDYGRYGAQGTVWDVKMRDTRGITPGTYRLELYLNNVKQQERTFIIN